MKSSKIQSANLSQYSSFKSNMNQSSKQTLNTKYTVNMAKELVLETFMTPKARELYKNRVQISSNSYTVLSLFFLLYQRKLIYFQFGLKN